MKTQLSQFPLTLHQPYSGVYQQQGRMITDADWNAATQIAKDRLERALADVIGKGTPQQGGIITGDEASGFEISWGELYVDGIRAELASASGAAAFDITDQADFPGAPGAPAGAHRLYVDIWERSLTGLEEPALLEVALHGADTSTRTRTMAQIKYAPQDFDPEDPAQNPPVGGGRLTLTLRAGSATPDACEPCLDEIDVSAPVGNYLFRVEIHDVQRDEAGAPRRLTLKWSRENAAEAALVGQEPPGFKASDWVYEFYHAASEGSMSESHAGFHHPGVIANGFTPARGRLTQGFPDSPPSGYALVRRWDGYIELEKAGALWKTVPPVDVDSLPSGVDRGQRLSPELGEAQHGHLREGATVLMALDTMVLKLELAEHQHLTGDYWIAPVREARDAPGDALCAAAAPDGVLHHYMSLADVGEDGSLTLLDEGACRRFQFPALSNLRADAVCYDNAACEMPGVGNVQQALDHLCKQKDLKWHNRHLHGWGIVCGLVVECCSAERPEKGGEAPDQCVSLTKGYAIDAEGEDIVLDAPLRIDLLKEVTRWDEANPNQPILTDGQGTACLHIASAAGQPAVRIEPHQPGDDDFLEQLLDGTLLGDFVQHCIMDLLSALSKELSFMEEGREEGRAPRAGDAGLVSDARRKFISFANLVIQTVNKANGPYVWLSQREYAILKELYDTLRGLLGSKTFCGLFNDDQFPPYPFPETRIDTWFGAERHTRIKADPTGKRVYTYGGTNEVIHVYDVEKAELVEILRMPVPEGGEVTALACSEDGKLLYAAASVSGADSILGIAQVGKTHRFERPMQILCGITITEMAVAPGGENLIYALGLGRGLFALRPDVLADVERPAPVPVLAFNAVGHMAIDTAARRIFCTATADDRSSVPPRLYDHIVGWDMRGAEGEASAMIFLDGFGEDGIAVRPGDKSSTVYAVVHDVKSGRGKKILTHDVAHGHAATGKRTGELEVENTRVALAFDPGADTLYAAFADSFRLQAISADGQTTQQMRVPVQIMPTDVALGPRGDVYTVNFLSSTVTAIPRDEVSESHKRLAPLANLRWRILLAFYALVGRLFQYLKDCFCHHLLLKCPETDGSEKIYLACVEIRDNKVYNICNFGKRKYVQTFMGWNYWLSLVPIIPLMKQAIARMCCSVLPDFLEKFTGNIAPEPPGPEYGLAAGVSTPLRAKTALDMSRAYKRADPALMKRQTVDKFGIFRNLAVDSMIAPRQKRYLDTAGLSKTALQNVDVETALHELRQAGIEQVEVLPYEPELAGQRLRDFATTPNQLGKASKVIVYERDGKAVLITEARAAGASAVKVSPEDEAQLARIEERVKMLRAERDTLRSELEELNSGLTAAAELRQTLKLEIDSLRPLKELEGMAATTIAEMEQAGIRTIGDLSQATEERLLTARIGKSAAERREFIKLAAGRLK